MPLPPEFLNELKSKTTCDIRVDPSTRWLYSTDASIYQIDPLGVVFPHTVDDLAGAVSIAADYRIPVLARGAGSSLAGQAIGAALILDCSRHLTKIYDVNIDRENDQVTGGQVTAEPGIVLNALNRAMQRHGLQFGPDPASAERATLGGSLANNATGAHSILYGMSADHLLSAEVILADGTVTKFADCDIRNGTHWLKKGIESDIYNKAIHIRENYAEAIRTHWPKVWRRASGYNLNYLLPWTPAIPAGWQSSFNPEAIYNQPGQFSGQQINLAPLLAGSEGTLAIIRRATLQLVHIPQKTILGVLAYENLADACDAVPGLLEEHHPSAVELISQTIIQLARSVPAYASQLSWVKGESAALLVVEFSGNEESRLRKQVYNLGPDVIVADTPALQKQVWTVRKVGLGILQSRPGEKKPATFIEDLAVPVEHLGKFVREMDKIMQAHQTTGDFYAHASAGCLHFRPILNIKTTDGIAEMRSIAEEAVDMVLGLGGAVSGEHGDGLSRSEWLERAYGTEIMTAFRELKTAADPNGLLNPGKIVDPQKMDQNLRSNPRVELAWKPVMDFTRSGGAPGPGGVVGAVEMCNGAGVCRKTETVMCPSFQATQDETFSTRGRANLIRATMIPGKWEATTKIQKAWETLDLCLACKGCKSECPSGVDVAKLKYEFMHQYYRTHRRRLRDYLFAYIGTVAPLGMFFAPLVNWAMHRPLLRREMEKYFGLSCQRPFPRFANLMGVNQIPAPSKKPDHTAGQSNILFLRDTFNHYFYPEIEAAAIRLLTAAQINITYLPVMGAGRTLISKGFLPEAKKHATRLIKAISRADPDGKLPVVGLEPSEMYTFRDEYLDFFPGNDIVSQISERAWLIDEYLLRVKPDFIFTPSTKIVYLHGHCYQKSRSPAPDGLPTGVGATLEFIRIAGYKTEVIDDGCCGMAGAFGYEAEHFNISMQVGELALFPSIRTAKKAGENYIIAAPGVSCRAQIEDGTGVAVMHPVQLADHALTYG